MAGWWLIAPVAAFLALLVYHDRVLRARELASRAVRYYERGLARIEDRWAGTGETGDRFRDAAHPYAEDLDLFGKGGLFELLSTARTRAGEDTLARWLLQSAAPETVLERQGGVAELAPKLDLREDLALLGEDARGCGDPQALIGWAEAPPVFGPGSARIAAAILALATLVCGSYYLWEPSPVSRAVLICLLAITSAFGFRFRQRVLKVAARVEEAQRDLSLLAKVLARIEDERFNSARLAQLRTALEYTPEASRRIARLSRLMELLDSRENWLMRIIGPPLLYGTQVAFAIEAWRADSGPHVRRWIEAVGEFEALSAPGRL